MPKKINYGLGCCSSLLLLIATIASVKSCVNTNNILEDLEMHRLYDSSVAHHYTNKNNQTNNYPKIEQDSSWAITNLPKNFIIR